MSYAVRLPMSDVSLTVCEMAFANHLGDDEEQYMQSLRESTGVLRYLFQAPGHSAARDNMTMDPRGVRQGIQVGTCTNMPLVDVDSELLGITRKAGFASQFEVRSGIAGIAQCVQRGSAGRQDGSAHHASEGFASGATAPVRGSRGAPQQTSDNRVTLLDGEDCRFSNPPSTLRGTGINRFEWLCRDPQEKAISPHPRVPINYRLVAKDNHRPLIEEPLVDRVSPVANSSGSIESFSDASVVGKDIEEAVATYPGLVTSQHWRDIGEVQRIMGRRELGPAPAAAEEHVSLMQISPA